MLGFATSQSLGNLLSKGHAGLTEHEIENELMPHQTGVNLLLASSSSDPKEDDFSPEAAEMLARNLAGVAAYAVLDLGHGLTAENRRLVTISKQVIICLESHRVAVSMAEQMLAELHDLGLGPMRVNVVLINRTPSDLLMSWQSVQQALQKEIMAIISPAPELAHQATENQVPMIQLQPDSITANQVRKLSEDMLQLLGSVSEQLPK
jgi:MinD-like ATPase involved in chromosome partitioning or flagellar assembly